MGDMVPYAPHMTLAIAQQKPPEVLEAEQQKRIEDAQVLEEKLKIIQESVPTRVYNTCSSSAGAGSSDFHMYRMIRKAEQERWKRIEVAHAANQEKEVFETKRKQREQEAEERTAKNRAKRQKKKAKQNAKKAVKGPSGQGAGQASGSGDDESEEGVEKNDLPQADLD